MLLCVLSVLKTDIYTRTSSTTTVLLLEVPLYASSLPPSLLSLPPPSLPPSLPSLPPPCYCMALTSYVLAVTRFYSLLTS